MIMERNVLGGCPRLVLWTMLHVAPLGIAQGVVIHFTTAPGLSVGVTPSGFSNGSVVTGHIHVDPATLPNPSRPLAGLSLYEYGSGGIAGYEFDVYTSAGRVHYDAFNSLDPSQNIFNLGSRILLQERPEDYLYFTATELGFPFYAELQLQDLAAPFTLLNGTGFPGSVGDLNARTFGLFVYQDAPGENYFQASINSISIEGVPEPGFMALLLLGGSTVAFLRSRGRNAA